jgi:hypothetical protein
MNREATDVNREGCHLLTRYRLLKDVICLLVTDYYLQAAAVIVKNLIGLRYSINSSHFMEPKCLYFPIRRDCKAQSAHARYLQLQHFSLCLHEQCRRVATESTSLFTVLCHRRRAYFAVALYKPSSKQTWPKPLL